MCRVECIVLVLIEENFLKLPSNPPSLVARYGPSTKSLCHEKSVVMSKEHPQWPFGLILLMESDESMQAIFSSL